MKLSQSYWFFISIFPTVALGGIQTALQATGGVIKGCLELQRLLPSQTFFADSPEYQTQQSHYWTSQQATDIHPRCRVTPYSTDDLRSIVKVVGRHQATFATKSGGHSTVSGASNIDDGITVDLAGLNSTELSVDDSSAWVGIGNTWFSVYRDPTLTSAGLSVTGARAGTVGVGGFLLGGGFSWHSGRNGWACDTVLDFEVVLANGSVVSANENDNPDLFWALKGGGSNFGIVTKVKIPVFKQDSMYMATTSYEGNDLPDVLVAMEDFTAEAEDPDAGLFMTIACDAKWGMCYNVMMFVNTASNTSSSTFEPFEKIPSFENGSEIMDMGDLSKMLSDQPGTKFRKEKFTLTFRNHRSVPLMLYLASRIHHYVHDPAYLRGARVIAITFQPLTSRHISSSGNAFGLDAEKEPLILFSAEVHWESSTRDQHFHDEFQSLESLFRKEAESSGLLHPFVYLNYAASWQKPFESYGDRNLKRLKDVRGRFDPDGVFTKLQPGSLHL
ncbi:FAD-binding domain-containing protein [Lophium mytilinum]|uniref:FAD-binding domain-containing protein n=1 Tax=Lophium mytilinum TaxID=390894 RepID=A0A6A6R8K3_9PEZI|nr:FAD-binding domain-containing protein [Lophium mytilinum]